MKRLALLSLLSAAVLSPVWAHEHHPAWLMPQAELATFDYHLQPVQVAQDTWVLLGKTEDFTPKNGGNIVNTGFIVTRDGVIVIDSGPSRRYGEQLRAAIARITPLPILRVLITHAHPDHFLGNQAFPRDTLMALPATRQAMQREGEEMNANLYRMSGDWMQRTEVRVPTQDAVAGMWEVGGHRLELLALQGHTGADLALFDHTTGVLFAGDLVFHRRAITTPHAALQPWLDSLAQLERLPLRLLVPGHGTPTGDSEWHSLLKRRGSTEAEVCQSTDPREPLRHTREYLQWLDRRLQQSAQQGLDMTEVLAEPLPRGFASWGQAADEYRRSVGHWYPAYEQRVLSADPTGERHD